MFSNTANFSVAAALGSPGKGVSNRVAGPTTNVVSAVSSPSTLSALPRTVIGTSAPCRMEAKRDPSLSFHPGRT